MFLELDMHNLLERIIELKNSEWDYYSDRIHDELSTDLSNPFKDGVDRRQHFTFIETYFKIAGKGDVFEYFSLNEDVFNRAIHTNSVFFLGCLLYKHLDLKGKMNIEQFNSGDHFFFVWFMTVLSHDLAYDYEMNSCKYTKDINYGDIDGLKRMLNIEDKFDLLSEKKFNNTDKILVENIGNYYKYRYTEHCKIDHGIVAGLNLFQALEKNRTVMNRKPKEERGKLDWSEKLKPLYAQASFAVSVHNIWAPQTQETAEQYKEYGIENLQVVFPISFQDFPLLFLLGLVDTLDPVKVFYDTSPQCVLANISICFINNNTIVFQNKEGSCLDFKELHTRAKSLVGWLNVKVSADPNPLTIKIEGI